MPHRKWLIGSAVLATAVFALMWIGYVQRWTWLDDADSAALDAMYRVGTAHPGWVTAWDVYCTVLIASTRVPASTRSGRRSRSA